MGIEQHFMTLAGIGRQQKSPTSAELDMSNLQAPAKAIDYQRLFAPVELKRFTPLKFKRYKRLFTGKASNPPCAMPGCNRLIAYNHRRNRPAAILPAISVRFSGRV